MAKLLFKNASGIKPPLLLWECSLSSPLWQQPVSLSFHWPSGWCAVGPPGRSVSISLLTGAGAPHWHVLGNVDFMSGKPSIHVSQYFPCSGCSPFFLILTLIMFSPPFNRNPSRSRDPLKPSWCLGSHSARHSWSRSCPRTRLLFPPPKNTRF